MSVSIIRQVNWTAVLPHVVTMVGFSFLMKLIGLGWDTAILLGAMIYLSLSLVLQYAVPFNHRRGIQLLKKENYEEAQKEFEASYAYFQEKAWLDEYRSITMLSASKMCYREMALLNIALCYLQLGQTDKAIAAYEKVLEIYPDSKMAKLSIEYINNPEPEEEEEKEIN